MAEELSILRKFTGRLVEEKAEAIVKPTQDKTPRSPKVTFQISRTEGRAKCIASTGRLDIRLSKDFSTIDRLKLEAAVSKFLDMLDE